MRILLLHPGVPAYGGKEDFRTFYPPLGLACIASPLLEAGHEVQILDTSVEMLSQDDVIRRALAFEADIVGMRCQFINYPLGLAQAKAIREVLPDTRIIFGGPHMGLVAEQALSDHPYLDAIVHGEGEHALLEYVDALRSGTDLGTVGGLIWRNEAGVPVRNAPRLVVKGDMDFPPPAFDLLPMHLYRVMNFFALEGHRGCPNKCTFCSLPTVQTRRVRYKKPERLVAEIERLVYEFGINRFEMLEVNFTILKRWAHEVCNLILEKQLPVQWICRSYPELVDKPTLQLMKQAGCYKIYYGIESGSAEILKNYKKVTKVQQGKDAIRMTKEVGIQVYCDFLVGGPGETEETVEETIRFVEETQPDYSDVSLIVPFPGTPMYDQAEELGIRIFDKKWYEDPGTVSQFPYVRTMELTHLPIKQLERLWVHAVTRIVHKERGQRC
jgi:anaerobic magnesium-protoporphyrin IX monomethyl ester cyclase